MRYLEVACAIIEGDGRVLAAQRSAAMSLPLKWEFPGGKIGSGETPAECLYRELREELGVEVAILRAIPVASHRYPDIAVTLHPFVCVLIGGKLCMHEHAALLWLLPEELAGLDWAEADLPIVAEYCRERREGGVL
ncbi:MAG: (deoxy)nucleoside triphosphate pyrophosphohydrolase [Desulfurivibrionaceae bacterium]